MVAEEQSAVLRAIAQHRIALLARERVILERMTAAWLDIEAELEARIVALAYRAAEMQAAGETVAIWRLTQLDRYQDLLVAIQRQVGGFTSSVLPFIQVEQRQLARLGVLHAAQGIRGAMVDAGIEVPLQFNVLPAAVVETMVGMAGPEFGAPLGELLREAWPDAVDGLTNALIRGVALGDNPRVVARAMADGMTDGLDRMMTIARTEMIRSYREATRQEYEQSGVVTGYRRIAAKDADTCLACIAMDGEEYETDELMEIHPNDRCAMIPIVFGMPPIEWQAGQDWLDVQSEEVQRQILGPTRYDLYADGTVASLRDFVATSEDPTWGPTLEVRPLEETGR